MSNAYNQPKQLASGIFIGSSFDANVKEQINIRTKKVRGGLNNERTNEEIVYLNSNTSWVRLSSAVDVKDKNGDSDNGALAKDNILQGGTIHFDGNKTVLKSNFEAYNNTKELGFRPMAGIENVSIKYKSRFGTLRDAEVKFRCSSLEQLEIMERLYMRPGYSVLLEWGHTIFYDNKETFTSRPTTLDLFAANLDKDTLYRQILNKRRETGGNYDALYGFVRNFNWSFDENGGYNCTTYIIAIGDVLDSLKINGTTNLRNILDGKTDPTLSITNSKIQSDLHAILYLIHQELDSLPHDSGIQLENTYKQYFEDDLIKSDPQLFKGYKVTFNSGEEFKFISLGALCSLINKNCLLYTGIKQPLTRIHIDTAWTRCLAHKDQISVDPGVCLIPGNSKSVFQYSRINDVLNINYRDNDAPFNGKAGIPFKILVNIENVIKILDNIINSNDNKEVSLQSFLQELLKQIGQALGNINNFSFSYDSETNEAIIVDEQKIPGLNFTDPSSLYTIPIFGLNSVVTKCNMSAEIFPEMSTMISIAAQNGGQVLGIDGTSLSLFNELLVDRIMKNKVAANSQQQKTFNTSATGPNISGSPTKTITTPELEKQNEIVAEYQDKINTIGSYVSRLNSGYYSKNDSDAITNIYRDYFSLIRRIENDYRATTLIPIKLSLTMMGISGMKIGQAFSIPDNRLPTDYRERKVAFIITGLSHSIQNNIWMTEMVGQMMMTGVGVKEQPEQTQIKSAIKDLKPNLSNSTSTEGGFLGLGRKL